MAAIYNFPSIIKGNTFKARKISVIVNTAPLDLTGANICMQLKASARSTVVHDFTHSISNPLLGEITLNKWTVVINEGTYNYDLKITLANGDSLTYIYGSFTVKQNISECL